MMSNSQTLIDKLWAMHEIVRRDDGASLLWVDRHYVHEGSFHAFSQMKARGRSVAEPTTHLRRGRSLRADPRPRRRDCQSRDRGHGAQPRGEHRRQSHHSVRPARPAPGHRACGRPRAGTDPARAADRLRRQPYVHARRIRRLCLRDRRVRSRARADDADALAEEAEAHAHHRRRQARRRNRGEGYRARDHRAHSRRRRAGPRHRICRQRHPRAVDGRPADALQHVDRGRRALRHGGARRDHFRLPEGPAVRAEGRRFRPRGRSLVGADDRMPTQASTARSRSTQTRSRRSSPGARRPTMHCRSTDAFPIPRARATRRAPNICARRSTIWGSRRERS